MGDSLNISNVYGDLVTYPPGATFGPRLLGDYELVWIVRGNVVYHVGGQDHAAPPGSIVLARAGFKERYTWDPQHQTRHAYFHYTVHDLPADWPAPEAWPVVRQLPEEDIVRPLFRYVIANVRPDRHAGFVPVPPMIRRAIETLLGALLVGPVRQVSEEAQDYPEPVRRALLYLRQTLAEEPARPLALADLARSAAVSPEHLCRLFRATFDTGPIEALWLLRLDMAMSLLARSNLNLSQIADRCGFASLYHFSRRFSRVYGRPASVMRKAIAGGESPPSNLLLKRMKLPR